MLARHIFELNFTHCKQKTHRCKDEHFTSSYLLWLVYFFPGYMRILLVPSLTPDCH
uniref:CSON011048 protein n=1 Tax=Culicoides sonorensis TaxID=179676 RepID=A0A336N3X4_CULSO